MAAPPAQPLPGGAPLNLRRNAVYGLLGFLLPALVVFVAYPVMLHRLGAAAFGVYLLSGTISGSLAFLEFGFTTATVKFVAEELAHGDRKATAAVVNASLVFYGLLGTVGLVAFWALAHWLAGLSRAGPELGPDAVVVFRIAAVQMAVGYVSGVFLSVFKGLQRFEFPTLAQTAASIATWGGATAAVILAGWGIVGVAAVGLATSVVVTAVAGWLAVKLLREQGVELLGARPTADTFRKMFRFGSFMFVNGLANVLASQVQSWVMANFLGPAAVAVYSTAVQIVSKINQLVSAGFEAVLPVAAQLARGRVALHLRELRKVYDKALALSFVASVGASGALFALSPILIRLWLRSDIDAQVVTVIRILALGLAVNGATPAVFHLVNGVGKPELNTAFMALGVVLFYGLLVTFGLHGLTVARFAWAQALSFIVSGAAYLLVSHHLLWRRWLVSSEEASAAPSAGG